MGLTSSKIPLTNLTTVVTGCDTGFGHETALTLAATHKAIVYAGCLTATAVEAFERMKQDQPHLYATLRPVQLDVTDWDAVQRFATVLERECPEGVFCLLNNAGINMGSLFTWTTVEEFRKVMDVNLMGAMYMMKALIPLMRRYVIQNPTGHAPRIVNITSMAGRTVAPILSAYCTSKWALEALSDSVRQELRPFGIRVAIIEPWFASTPLVVGNVEGEIKKIRDRFAVLANRTDYGDPYLEAALATRHESPALTMKPVQVINVLIATIQAQEPKHRQIVGAIGRVIAFLYMLLPSRIMDPISASSFGNVKPHGAVRNGRQGLLSWL
ncbi:hypothetical protein PhCBS80983_g00589 [Powellomyces hirtus]|uniref:Uncharacterized protein n=1 Tax=Powellomyces hirtus TaxID=109895 RepID=A0A507EF77_9FUNG|nr:hypothetical protein PhCBS80983_g00589 [Powellomyces hirtus]